MRRIVLIIPDLLSSPEAPSFLRGELPSFSNMARMGRMSRVSPIPEIETPEAVYLGMDPREGQLKQGPLTLAALGFDPPDHSTHFHVSILSSSDGRLSFPDHELAPEIVERITKSAERLNTRKLTFVAGKGSDHGLVWEGVGDLKTFDPRKFVDEPIRAQLPEGDIEVALRRFIDDSINLLSELEFNARLVDEGLPMLNALWPWGEGVRLRVPNLALRLGEPVRVESNSTRLAGLCRLVGYSHGNRNDMGSGTHTRLDALADRLLRETAAIGIVEAPSEMRERSQWEELDWLTRRIDRELLAPLLEASLREGSRLTLIAPGDTDGLSVSLTKQIADHSLPFDERALGEKSIPKEDVWHLVNAGLTHSDSR